MVILCDAIACGATYMQRWWGEGRLGDCCAVGTRVREGGEWSGVEWSDVWVGGDGGEVWIWCLQLLD